MPPKHDRAFYMEIDPANVLGVTATDKQLYDFNHPNLAWWKLAYDAAVGNPTPNFAPPPLPTWVSPNPAIAPGPVHHALVQPQGLPSLPNVSLPEVDLPFPFGDPVRAQYPLALTDKALPSPFSSRAWFANQYDAQLKRRISMAVTKLWEYFTFPLRDRAGEYHYSRLLTPWIYYKDLNVVDLFEVFVSPVLGVSATTLATLALGDWVGTFFKAIAVTATAEKALAGLSRAVTDLLKRKARVPREIRDALAISSVDIYDGNTRWRLPGLTDPAPPLAETRNLALDFPLNLFSYRGMNKTVTFSRVRSCR